MSEVDVFWVRIGFLLLLLIGLVLPMLKAFATGVPYVPTSRASARRIAELLGITPDDRVLDPGCGDGRLLAACLDAGARSAVGYELFFLPYLMALWTARRYGRRFELRFEDSRTRSFAGFSVVVCYMMPEVLVRMKQQFEQLPAGARIASYAFPIAGWTPTHVEPRTAGRNESPIFLYVRGQEGGPGPAA